MRPPVDNECPSRFVLALSLVDGELAPERLVAVREHLAGCDACRSMRAQLQQERQTLLDSKPVLDLADEDRRAGEP